TADREPPTVVTATDVRAPDSAVRSPDLRKPSAVSASHATARGTFSIDSTPFATVYVDDRELGITPLIHQPLPAGHHKLRAVLKDGRKRDLDLDVPAGKAAPAIRLTW